MVNYSFTQYNNYLQEFTVNYLNSKNEESKNILVDDLLKYLGESFLCDRVYVFKFYSDNIFCNTHEWCNKDVVSEKENLQNENLLQFDKLIENFKQNKFVFIENIEDIKYTDSSLYGILKLQDVKSIVAVPFFLGNEVKGFVGIDNPKLENDEELEKCLEILNLVAMRFSFFESLDEYNENAENIKELQDIRTYPDIGEIYKNTRDIKLKRFIRENYFDLGGFIESVSRSDHYLFMCDMQKNVWYISDEMKETLGLTENIVHDLNPHWISVIATEEDRKTFIDDFNRIITEKEETHDLIYRIKSGDGEISWIHCIGVMRWDEEKTKPLFFSGHVIKLENVVFIDPTTGLLKEQGVIKEISVLKQNNEIVNIVCFKFMNFHEINEIRGRIFTDKFLKNTLSKLLNEFSNNYKFFRLDGLRFLVVIQGELKETVESIVLKIKNIIHKEYKDNGIIFPRSCVVGILDMYDKFVPAEDIIENAINLLEIGKENKDKEIVYSSLLLKEYADKKELERHLMLDVNNGFNNFRIVIQPIVLSTTHRVESAEALLRWKYKEKDISPAIFIPILEKTGFINEVGRFVFEQVVKVAKRIDCYTSNVDLHFNLSYKQLDDDLLIPFINEKLKKWDVSGDKLILELTEGYDDVYPEKLQEFIKNIKKLNMRMAIDDFGVGYSSLDILLKYPADIVKIDKNIMRRLSNSKEIRDFITSIVYSCHQFGKLVCIEGVETEEELILVKNAGCDYIQGFYFYKPIEINDFYDIIAKG